MCETNAAVWAGAPGSSAHLRVHSHRAGAANTNGEDAATGAGAPVWLESEEGTSYVFMAPHGGRIELLAVGAGCAVARLADLAALLEQGEAARSDPRALRSGRACGSTRPPDSRNESQREPCEDKPARSGARAAACDAAGAAIGARRQSRGHCRRDLDGKGLRRAPAGRIGGEQDHRMAACVTGSGSPCQHGRVVRTRRKGEPRG
jgi:hypothetical protein